MGIFKPVIDISGNAGSANKLINDSGIAPSYSCRAWVNFNASGVAAIRASKNVSSIVDNGVGNFTVNFANAMQDANYAFACSMDGAGGATLSANASSSTTSNINVIAWFSFSTNYETLGDPTKFCVSIFS